MTTHQGDSAVAVLPSGKPVRLVSIPLACCAVEVSALCSWARQRFPQEAASVQLTVVLLAGTVTWPVVQRLREQIEQVPGRTVIVAVGACTSKGGPYWDSAPVVPGAQQVVEVDVLVAGCPPTPDSIWNSIVTYLTEQAEA